MSIYGQNFVLLNSLFTYTLLISVSP